VHDRVGGGRGDRGAHGRAIRHVERRTREGDDVVAAPRGVGGDDRAQHAARSGDEQLHQRISISDSSPTMNR
jgi:hypothetical protein